MMQLFSKIWENRLLAFLLFLLVMLAVGVCYVAGLDNPQWIVNLLGVSEAELPKYEVLKILGIGMGGILIAVQAAIANKRAHAMQQTAQAQVRATEEQANANRHTEQGQRQERLKNAIEHLGHDKDSVRLGGAYELCQLGRDTKNLRQTVVDILCAHIRRTTSEAEYQKVYRWRPSEEIQSMLSLLFVQQSQVFEGLHIDLQGSWLNGANLCNAHLENAALDKASLQVAMLFEADLRSAKLQEAHLHGAHLIGADLQGAFLWKALLFGAWLSWADLRDASFDEARLQGARLMQANLQCARLMEAHMQGAFLDGADLRAAFLGGAQLQGANLCKAKLQGAGLQETEFHGVESREVSAHSNFAERLRASIGRASDLSGAILAGGLSEGDVGSIVAGLGDDHAKIVREKLTPHIGMPESHEMPQDSGAMTGAFTEEDAEQLIAEYEETMSKVPEVD